MKSKPLWILLTAVIGLTLSACSSGPVKKEDPNSYKPGVYKTGKSVTFIYQAPRDNVSSVALTGDFNNWQKDGIPLNYVGGLWTVTFNLEYGIYQYKYVLDGTEMASDPYADAFAPDGKGGKNSIVEVKKQ